MIEIIEKEPYRDDNQHLLHPTYMLKDDKEYFMFNRVEPSAAWDEEENKERKQQLIDNDGAYFCFYGRYTDPMELLKNMAKGQHRFIKTENMHFRADNGSSFWHFAGNVKGLFGAAFLYNIYDATMAGRIQSMVEYINREEWNKALSMINSEIVEEFLKTRSFCILPVDTGGFFLYNAEHDCLLPLFVFTAEDQIYDDISITKNEDGTYHIEYVGDEEPSQLFEEECGDMYKGYNDFIASYAISDISSLAAIVDTYEEQGELVDDMLQAVSVGGNPVLHDIVDKYDLGMFANADNFARAANAIKEAAPELYEKHKLGLQVMEIFGAPNTDDKLSIDDVYQMQKTRGKNLFDKQTRSAYKKTENNEKEKKNNDVERN